MLDESTVQMRRAEDQFSTSCICSKHMWSERIERIERGLEGEKRVGERKRVGEERIKLHALPFSFPSDRRVAAKCGPVHSSRMWSCVLQTALDL